jgi:hypothetical protein
MQWWHVSGGGQQGCQRLLTYMGVCTVVRSRALSGVVQSSWVMGPRSASGVRCGLVLGGVGVLVVVVVVVVGYLPCWVASVPAFVVITGCDRAGGG